MAAALVPRELSSWALVAVALGALEGGLLGVIVKNQFAHVASPAVINFAVAVVVGAPAYGNLSSFLFASLAVGRNKIAVLTRLMQLIAVCLVVMSLAATTSTGLLVFCAGTIMARMAWSGILTIRAAVWRANYQRTWRAQVTARIVQLASLLIAGFSALVGLMLDWRDDAYRFMFPLAACCALAASFVYRQARVRRHRQLLRAELADQSLQGGRLGLSAYADVLRENREFRLYMIGMMVFGSGNMMVIAMLVVMLNEHFEVGRLDQVMITASLPLLALCLSIRFWAKLLDQKHIFEYRALHSWSFFSAFAIFAAAVIWKIPALLWPGSILLGAAYAGGHLGWNLGHNDFTDSAKSSLYMTIHVGLTGIRGLFMPVAGVIFYQYLEYRYPGYGPYAILLPLTLSFMGSSWFVYLFLERKRRLSSEILPGDDTP
jgi:MFS family permease